ncbi:radical SAM protein [Caldicellulosiruptor changbaiensis]|uniref:Radical SAM protein n=1 Tax=Caldicellulosiruptor changbaiensis TaxID=1222016 RepID=A0A3T0D6H2_9FIRM|nr:radical SAM protein [Caldicellulosiruptor changbaiensis]AZT90659.1 radical SAM protein [Caldicellulosiruptor changbaiensis]
MKCRILPIFIPQYGCPFKCIFCNQKIISGEKEDVTVQRIKRQIEEGLSKNKGEDVELAYYGGNFTAIDIKMQQKLLELAKSFEKIKSIRISTRPDCIDKEILGFLKDYNVKTIELGIQSMFDDVLEASKRGHTAKDSVKAIELIKSFDFLLGVQLMVGLPSSTLEKDIKSAEILCNYQPNIARIYPTLVIEDTYLAEMYKKGEYQPLSLEEAVLISSQIKEIFIDNNVKVIRVGLQPTEEINYNAKVVAGPFHPSFGELVDSEIIFRRVTKVLVEENIKDLKIFVHPKNFSKLVGQKKRNIERLKERYNLDAIKIINEYEDPDAIRILADEKEVIIDIKGL